MPKSSRERDRSPDSNIGGRDKYEEIPEEFFCPISKEFLSDPVRIPNHDITYDRKSVQHLHPPENVRPDLRMRMKIQNWFSRYDVDPTFRFISNQEDLAVAVGSVVEQRRSSLLRKLATVIRDRPWLMKNGQCISCVATLLSRPYPSSHWMKTTLSIVANLPDDIELLVPNTGIDPEYSFLDPIIKALESDLSDIKKECKIGLVKLMHGLVVNSAGIVPMSRKLKEIIKVLVSYLWPVWPLPKNFVGGWYQKIVLTLERLSENEENCQRMVDVGIVGMLMSTFVLGVTSVEEIRNSGRNDSASVTIEAIMKLFDRVSQLCKKSRKVITSLFVAEVKMFSTVLFNHVKSDEAFVAGARVLAYIIRESRKFPEALV